MQLQSRLLGKRARAFIAHVAERLQAAKVRGEARGSAGKQSGRYDNYGGGRLGIA